MELKRLFILITVLVVYLCVGSVMFSALERQGDIERINDIRKDLNEFIENTTDINVAKLHRLLLLASENNELIYEVIHNRTNGERWEFGTGFGFAVSVVTTIGYGNMAPHTVEGKIVCVCYALFGIPIAIMILSALGEKLAKLFARINKVKLCSRRPMVNKILNMVLIISLGLVIMFIAPAAVLQAMEGWGIMESLYFCFITLSTIGFGDLTIAHEKRMENGSGREAYQIAVYVWILFGLSYLSLVIKYITDVLVTGVSKVERQTIRRLESEMTRIQEKTTKLKPALGQSNKFKQIALDAVRLERDKTNVELVSVSHI